MQLLIQALNQSLLEKDLFAMEKLLQQGASLARTMLGETKGPPAGEH